MNVLIITQYYWPENFPINDLALGLREHGHKVTIYTGKPNYPGGRFYPGYGFFARPTEEHQGIQVIRVPLIPRGGGGALRLVLNYLSFAAIASFLAPLRCHDRYDFILVYEPSPITVGLPALVLRWWKHVPILFWVQDLWPESLSATGAVQSRWLVGLVGQLVQFIYRRCALVLAQSEAFSPYLQAQGVPADRIRYYPNSAETLYQPIAVEPHAPERSSMPEGFRVMFAGNIGVAQDFETIVAAAEILKGERDIHWIIIGDGRAQRWVEQEIERRGLHATMHLLGRRPVQSMPRFFALADVMLVTLKRDPIFSLTVPSKVQSYFACGRPVLAALDGEGARVIREAGAGIAVKAGDPTALADAVLQFRRMPAPERKAMGQRGADYFAQNFERSLLISRLEAWGRELMERR